MGSDRLHVRLRDVQEGDLPILFEHQIDPVAHRMAVFTPRDRDAFMAHWAKILADETVVKKAVLLDGRVAGHVVIFERSGRWEVGYWIGREHWGRGIATRALAQLLPTVSRRPLHAFVAKQNTASIRVLEKSGFVVEEEIRGSHGEGGPLIEDVLMRLDTKPLTAQAPTSADPPPGTDR